MDRAAEVLRRLLDADRAAKMRVNAAREQAKEIAESARQEGARLKEGEQEEAERAKEAAIAAAKEEPIEAPEPPGPDPQALRRRADQNMDAAVDRLVSWITVAAE